MSVEDNFLAFTTIEVFFFCLICAIYDEWIYVNIKKKTVNIGVKADIEL